MNSCVNRYSVPKRHGDRMLSLINKYHSTGVIDMMKTEKDIVFTVVSDPERDFFDCIPETNIKNKNKNENNIKNKPDFACESSIQKDIMRLLKSIIVRSGDISIQFKNARFRDILEVCEKLDAEKILIIDNICIFIGINNKVYYVDHKTGRRTVPKLDIFKGFVEMDEIGVNYLNILHETWLKNGMKGEIFNDNFVNTYDMTETVIKII